MTSYVFIVGYLVLINCIALGLLVRDKHRSVHKMSNRVPEGLLFFLAVIGGSVGVYLGMLLFHHKTKKWYFQLGIPLLILKNLAAIYALRELFLLLWS